MTSFSISLSEFFVTVAFMSGEDALRTADGSLPFSGANLEVANLYGANLEGANLEGANLQGAYLRDANLQGANLEGANLRGAYLRGADLYGANLKGADLYGADLRGADLYGANLKGADLYGADLRGAKKIAVIYAYGMSSRGDFLYAVAGAGASILFKAGCFWGSEGDLRAKVIAEKGDSKSARLYLMAIDFLAMALSEAE